LLKQNLTTPLDQARRAQPAAARCSAWRAGAAKRGA
jgi:hypothetical protein